MATATFDSRALLALDPRALGATFTIPVSRDNQRIGTREIVSIEGPLTSKDEGTFDSYESIKSRVQLACAGDALTVVLRLLSPGGEVHQCFSTSRDIRQMCVAAGKQLIAYCDGQTCSAAYAIACAAPTIVAAETSVIGSIGVITERKDISEMLAREGVRVSYVVSGAHKSYGHPETPESEAERMDSQHAVNNLAALFFGLVEQHRGIPAAQVAMLQAGTFIGQEAVKAGLVDAVATYESLFVETINASPLSSDPLPDSEAPVSFAEVCEALSQLALSDEEYAQLATMLKALDTKAEDPPPDPPAEETPEEEKKEEPADAPPAADSAVETAAALATQLESALAENATLKARLDTDAKHAFFAQHSVSDTLKAVLESKPLAEIEAIVAAMQAKPTIKPGLATLKTVQGQKSFSASAEDRSLDRAFGINKDEGPAVSTRGQVQTFRLVGR